MRKILWTKSWTTMIGLVSLWLMGLVSPCGAEVSAGNTITIDTVSQAEPLLTPSTRWMLEQGMPMQIIATKGVTWPKAYEEATEKFASQVSLSGDGRRLINYVAGCPFPSIDLNDPLAGFRIMWNQEHPPFSIDNFGTDSTTQTVNAKGDLERTFSYPWRRLMWTGRLYSEPKPIIPHARGVSHTNLIGPAFLPNDHKGTSILYFRYHAPDALDDTYAYIPETRRVHRVSIVDRSTPLWRTDVDLDSWWGFNAKLSFWTFRVLADKDILAVVHSDKYGDPSAWCAAQNQNRGILAALPCVPWEKRRVWVVEATPVGYSGRYTYSKRVLYVDQEFFAPVIQEIYDLQGDLWKVFLRSIAYTNKPHDRYPINPLEDAQYDYSDEWAFMPQAVMVDMQAPHATTFEAPAVHTPPAEWQSEWYFNENIPSNNASIFSRNYLIRSGR